MKSIRLLAVVAVALGGCGSSGVDDVEEVGHAAADVMASLDETGTSGTLAWNAAPIDRPGFDRSIFDRASELAMPSAYAAVCWARPALQFSTCDNGVRTKDFGSCTLGLSTLEGDVTLTFSDPACTFEVGSSVTRTADFKLTGRRNATLTVSSPGGGQRVTHTAPNGYTYEVLGMERIMTSRAGETLFDIATKTDEPLVVTGTSRATRVINSGKLEIEHKLAGYTLTLVPENLTWDGTCNCPVSGKLTGSITGGKNSGDTASVEFQGCGSGTVTVGGESKTVSFDRCSLL